MIQTLHIDLSNAQNKSDVFALFSHFFGFPSYFGNNWDAFFDVMQSLDTETDWYKMQLSPITGVHVILDGFDLFESQFPENDLAQFYKIFVNLSCNSSARNDHLIFTFQVQYKL